ncbi:unnamed protein product [Paramecium sonneborni]|uniref:Transmembrane protein n=1 Tax=Paramecium sonneborni TaxID=65129 RepID=A0A8S1NXY1_9CILI|nr:unnamed protein product [Paramecium sonneborni]
MHIFVIFFHKNVQNMEILEKGKLILMIEEMKQQIKNEVFSHFNNFQNLIKDDQLVLVQKCFNQLKILKFKLFMDVFILFINMRSFKMFIIVNLKLQLNY